MTDDEKVEIAVKKLTEWHIPELGGYPYPGRWLGDVFVYYNGALDGEQGEVLSPLIVGPI